MQGKNQKTKSFLLIILYLYVIMVAVVFPIPLESYRTTGGVGELSDAKDYRTIPNMVLRKFQITP